MASGAGRRLREILFRVARFTIQLAVRIIQPQTR
ncbi:MAG: hypothetical protein H6Q31_2108, partial [Bacteroidetes bacterium]|nr:hypothetical protein [Bacteroidota bacterium]